MDDNTVELSFLAYLLSNNSLRTDTGSKSMKKAAQSCIEYGFVYVHGGYEGNKLRRWCLTEEGRRLILNVLAGGWAPTHFVETVPSQPELVHFLSSILSNKSLSFLHVDKHVPPYVLAYSRKNKLVYLHPNTRSWMLSINGRKFLMETACDVEIDDARS